jgi:hypothetical protein
MNSMSIALACIAAGFATTACGSGQGSYSGPSESSATGESALVQGSSHRGAILPQLPATPTFNDTTVPRNGDLNPYGVAFVPPEFPGGGILHDDDVIVSNFNNKKNLQGTGFTIVRASRTDPPATTFFKDDDFRGFSTALGILKKGFVLVGNVPSTDKSGMCNADSNGVPLNVGPGAILVIDRHGRLVQKLTGGKINGPWDLTLDDEGDTAKLFVSNVLDGTVVRIDLSVENDGVRVQDETRVASGYMHRCDPNAFVLGPTGLAYDEARDVLYVASTADNQIFAVHHAGSTSGGRGVGAPVVDDPQNHLHGPLGLVRAANGDLLSAQGDAVNGSDDVAQTNLIVEFTADGRFVDQIQVDTAPGSAFGVALDETCSELRFAAVDDGTNTVQIFVVR